VLAALAAKGRDNARTPVQWDSTEHAGFTSGVPWLPVAADRDVVNAAAEVADPDSVFHHYRRLVELRHRSPVVVDGRFELLLPEHPQLWVLTRVLGAEVLLVVANCSSTPVAVPWSELPDAGGAELMLGTHGTGDTGSLLPWESRVLLLHPASSGEQARR
jgi:oligo-1,6-glucosidase